MSIIHLSDSDIQEYLDTQKNKEKVESHILSCEECAVNIAEYEAFYVQLKVDDTPELSADFVDQTMAVVREESILDGNSQGFYMYSLVSVACTFLLMKYYVGFDFSFLKFELPQFNNFAADWSIFNTASSYYQSSPDTVNILLAASMVLLLVALADSIISRKNLGKVSCLSI